MPIFQTPRGKRLPKPKGKIQCQIGKKTNKLSKKKKFKKFESKGNKRKFKNRKRPKNFKFKKNKRKQIYNFCIKEALLFVGLFTSFETS